MLELEPAADGKTKNELLSNPIVSLQNFYIFVKKNYNFHRKLNSLKHKGLMNIQ